MESSYKFQTLVQMWELIICPICKDLFNDPKILPCVHSFCGKCLSGLAQVKQDAFQCPVCRALTQLPAGGVADIPSNFFLNSILDIMKRQRHACGEDEILCDACCVNVLSSLRCEDCEVLLCTKCLQTHGNHKRKTAHGNHQEVRSSSENVVTEPGKQHQLRMPLKCKRHPKQDLRFFCNSCAELVCQDCVIAKHVTHIFVSASDAVPSCKAKLNTLLNQITTKLLFLSDALRDTKNTEEQLRSCVADIINRIHTTKNELVTQSDWSSEELDKDEKGLVNRLNAVARKKFEVLEEHRRKLETRLGLIENCRKFTLHLMCNGSDEEILTMENCIMESLGGLCQQTPEIPIECPENSYISFTAGVTADQGCRPPEGGNVLGTVSPGEGCGGCCFATGEGLTSTMVGQDSTFTITVKNDRNKACNEGRGSIVARVKTTHGGYFRAEMIEHKLGKQKFRYRTYIAGPHVLRITIKGEEILGSPFEPLSNGSTDYSRRGRLITKFGRAGTGDGELCSPHGLAVDRLSRIFVADTGNHRIQVFNESGRFLFAFGQKGSELGEFNEPCDVTISRTGHVVVADMRNDRLQVFTCEGNFVSQVSSGIVRPSAVTMDSYNNMVVVDQDQSRVLVLTMAGEVLRSITRASPKGKKGLENVQGVACSQTGEMFLISRISADQHDIVKATTQTYSSLIQVFDNNGNYIREFVIPSYVSPASTWCRLLMDNDDRVLATGAGNKVQVFTKAGGHLTNITFTEKDYKQIEISAIALSPNESVVVADSINARILVF